ncbi:hypothetical protein QQS21_007282 [Conoideocrella luteorostrata]|uniref:FAD-binding domain-containing protein n=1 Tax=Conoideocrella luteorostrata TaxID=1105319 RepID=A0AAJ0FZK4_9HYPO|nr:hypothetical protein QQS21_007282 [Conoideocrella luteorostrata]
MIHTKDAEGKIKNIPMVYGPQGQVKPNAKLFFNHKLVSCDFDNRVVTFESSQVGQPELLDGMVDDGIALLEKPGTRGKGMKTGTTNGSKMKSVKFDFLIGADGTHSCVRQSMMRALHMDFSQEYLQALWCDFIFPAAEDGGYRMRSTCLHIWPADHSIVICQPDVDGSFRAGMVCDAAKVRYYETHPDEFADFFDKEFPGIIPDILSAQEVTQQFVKHLKIPLKSVKCGTIGFKDRAILLGDSSHTMTPFYAMGMVTGLEDVRVFFQEFRDPKSASQTLAKNTPFCAPGTIDAYSKIRLPDVHAMVDLAAEHYHVLRFGVRSPTARTKKTVESFLSRWAPSWDWTTLYSRIQFGHERFTIVRQKEARQTKIITRLLAGAMGFFTSMVLASLVIFAIGMFAK